MIPTDAQVAEFQAAVRTATSVLISTHLNPDGDALGSALAMSHYLDQLGVPNEVICNNLAPYNLEFLPGVDRVRLEPTRSHDLAIVLDLDSMTRLGRTQPAIEACGKLILIDHHVPHEEPGDLRIVDVSSPATALILTRLLQRVGATLTAEISSCLLAGIVTDTGSFRYRNTTPEALHAAAALLEHGGDIVQICEEVYQRKPLMSVKLLGKTLDNMKLEMDGKLAYSQLSLADFEETGAGEPHTEGLVNELLFINTVQIAFVVREPQAGKVRASIRSRGPYDVTSAVRPFGGGGHKNAAGCTFEEPLESALAKLVEALKACLASS